MSIGEQLLISIVLFFLILMLFYFFNKVYKMHKENSKNIESIKLKLNSV